MEIAYFVPWHNDYILARRKVVEILNKSTYLVNSVIFDCVMNEDFLFSNLS